MAKYVCTTPCWHGKHRYHLNELAEFSKDEFPKDKKGELRNFRLIDGRKKESIPTIDEDVDITVKVNQKERKIG